MPIMVSRTVVWFNSLLFFYNDIFCLLHCSIKLTCHTDDIFRHTETQLIKRKRQNQLIVDVLKLFWWQNKIPPWTDLSLETKQAKMRQGFFHRPLREWTKALNVCRALSLLITDLFQDFLLDVFLVCWLKETLGVEEVMRVSVYYQKKKKHKSTLFNVINKHYIITFCIYTSSSSCYIYTQCFNSAVVRIEMSVHHLLKTISI